LDSIQRGLNCDFESDDLCSWSNDKTRSLDEWILNKPEHMGFTDTQDFFKKISPAFKTGPQNGNRIGNKSLI
jgi:hypothetical protein